MPFLTLLAFLFFGSSLISLWFKKEPKVWGFLLCLSILSGVLAGQITVIGLLLIVCLAGLWFFYTSEQNIGLFIALVCLSFCFKLRLLPGFNPYFFTPKFAVGLINPLIGFFPLALLVPLAKSWTDWSRVFKGVMLGCAGIAMLAFLADLSGASKLDFKLPSYIGARLLSNLFLTCIPEEGFYRGFIQNTLSDYFKKLKLRKMSNIFALILTSLLFTMSHLYWSPNLGILAFTFLTGLLYGGVYLYSGKIESAILCHFLFNAIHMTFFSYHAM